MRRQLLNERSIGYEQELTVEILEQVHFRQEIAFFLVRKKEQSEVCMVVKVGKHANE